jgi:hypothetical protein
VPRPGLYTGLPDWCQDQDYKLIVTDLSDWCQDQDYELNLLTVAAQIGWGVKSCDHHVALCKGRNVTPTVTKKKMNNSYKILIHTYKR